MRIKLQHVLPVAQMALASALLLWSHQWTKAMTHIQDMPGPSPAFMLLISINAPVALPRAFWFRYLPDLWDSLTFIVTIGLLWYWVALNVQSWRARRRVCMFAAIPLRLIGDLIVISIGVFWGFLSWRELCGSNAPIFWLGSPSSNWLVIVLCIGFQVAWCAALLAFFGRDFIQGVQRWRS